MMKSKKGFTLTEVLVALAVVGVIAALVIPQLVNRVQRNSAGATLGKAVAQIELGVQNLIQDTNMNSNGSIVTTITGTGEPAAGKDYFDKLIPYVGLFEPPGGIPAGFSYQELIASLINTPIFLGVANAAPAPVGYENFKRNDPCEKDPANCMGIEKDKDTNNKAELNYELLETGLGKIHPDSDTPDSDDSSSDDSDSDEPIAGGIPDKLTPIKRYSFKKLKADILILENYSGNSNEDAVITNLLIDTNGLDKQPNMLGRDTFGFSLTNRGKLIPFGVREDNPCVDGNLGNGAACAARVVKDGFKINY